jgi:hypothetical protein
MSARPAVRQHAFEQPHLAQYPGGVWPEHHSGADLAQLGSFFVDHDIDAGLVERDGRGYAADPASDNSNAFFYRHVVKSLAKAEANFPGNKARASLCGLLDGNASRWWNSGF